MNRCRLSCLLHDAGDKTWDLRLRLLDHRHLLQDGLNRELLGIRLSIPVRIPTADRKRLPATISHLECFIFLLVIINGSNINIFIRLFY